MQNPQTLQYPQNMQNPQIPQNPHDLHGNQQHSSDSQFPLQNQTEDTNTVTESVENFGIDKNNIIDRLLNELKLPFVVMVIFILFSFPQFSRYIDSLIKIPFIQRSPLNMLLLKSLLVGTIFYFSNLLLRWGN